MDDGIGTKSEKEAYPTRAGREDRARGGGGGLMSGVSQEKQNMNSK